jgi:hypothetical protein
MNTSPLLRFVGFGCRTAELTNSLDAQQFNGLVKEVRP